MTKGTAVFVDFFVGFLVGGSRVLIGVRLKAVPVAIGVALLCKFGQGCRATGKCRQLDGSEHIFKVNVVDCAPWQIRIRLPPVTSAVRQLMGASELTSK